MGKFLKACLKLGVICVILGAAASAVGISKGGLETLKEEVLNGEWSFGDGEIEPFFELEESDFFENDQQVYTVMEYQEEFITASEAEKLHMKSAGVTVELLTYAGTDIKVAAQNIRKYQSYVKDGVLFIAASGKNEQGDTDAEVWIYLPETDEGQEKMDIEVEAAASVVELGNIWADEVRLEVSAGTVSWNALYARVLEVKMAAGVVTGAYTEISEDTDIEMAAGAFKLEGILGTRTVLKGQAGSMKLVLKEACEAYDYDISCAGGSVRVGEYQTDGIAKKVELQNNAAKHMNIECSAGSVSISFEE